MRMIIKKPKGTGTEGLEAEGTDAERIEDERREIKEEKMKKEKIPKSNGKKKVNLKFIFGIILGAVLLIGIAGFVYVNDYYHADDIARTAATEASDLYTVEKGEHDELIFTPAETAQSALIFYPGGKVEYTAYAPLMCKLAERGILCILVHMPCNLAILNVDAAETYRNQYPDIGHWYISGHSLGGASASLYLQKYSSEYDGLILLGAYSSVDLSQADLKVLAAFGENDGVMNREKYQKDLANLPADYQEYVIPGGCHSYFGNYGMQKGDGIPTITADEQQELTADVINALIN